jgi:hypothetical protein
LIILVTLAALVPAGATARTGASLPDHSCGPGFIVVWKHGSANFVRVHGMTCARARTVIADALDHALVKPSAHYRNGAWVQAHGYFVLERRRMLGFTFTYQHAHYESHFVARRGGQQLTFSICWLNVNC